eukprot:CAMPEP_0173287370 /NCGR_PEP_ID=MMETSP1143-20121109/9742_1 /TAXON_ID=483371 /ORGANISM="non described non described, Strain CCMP2298" /LENGTH=157 /DNA_ID=CAMNT_0014225853 /DNA_START=662 /DNA_END=1136 /DNA_ORIENTATION=-
MAVRCTCGGFAHGAWGRVSAAAGTVAGIVGTAGAAAGIAAVVAGTAGTAGAWCACAAAWYMGAACSVWAAGGVGAWLCVQAALMGVLAWCVWAAGVGGTCDTQFRIAQSVIDPLGLYTGAPPHHLPVVGLQTGYGAEQCHFEVGVVYDGVAVEGDVV